VIYDKEKKRPWKCQILRQRGNARLLSDWNFNARRRSWSTIRSRKTTKWYCSNFFAKPVHGEKLSTVLWERVVGFIAPLRMTNVYQNDNV